MPCPRIVLPTTRGRVVLVIVFTAVLAATGCRPADEEAPAPGAEAPGGDQAGSGGLPCTEPWAKGFDANDCTLENGNPPPISPLDWPNTCSPNAVGWTPIQQSFDQLSWRSFLWNSWPAGADGQPDESQSIGVAGSDGKFATVVWEDYADASVLFGSDAANLTAADYDGAAPVPDGCSADGPRVLSMTSKVPHTSIEAVRAALAARPEGTEDGAMLEGLQSIDQAFRGPLYPQGPKGPSGIWPVFYEIRINDVEFLSIVEAGAQNKSPDELNCTGKYKTSTCTPFSFEMDSTEVKAAWKVLSDEEASSGRFFQQDLQVKDPVSGDCSVQTVGLVGLHIARKVPAAVIGADLRKNTWAWATFEQTDNVPPVGQSGENGTWSFNNPSCTPAVDAATCAGLTTPNPDPQYQCCQNLYRYAAGTVPSDPTPDQVTRVDDSPAGTQSCNAVYDPLDKGVFDHYTLIATQWPKANDVGGAPVVTPAVSRNAVIETYFTAWQNGQQVNQSSCMGCHSGGSAVDMSYLFLGNANGGS